MLVTLKDVIRETESAGFQFATRFEDAAYASWAANPLVGSRAKVVEDIRKAHRGCSNATARQIACTSFGLWQVMGFCLYGPECSYTQPYGVFLNSVTEQSVAYDSYIKARNIADVALEDIIGDIYKRRVFIERYNGTGDVDGYWNEMKRAMRSLGIDPDSYNQETTTA